MKRRRVVVVGFLFFPPLAPVVFPLPPREMEQNKWQVNGTLNSICFHFQSLNNAARLLTPNALFTRMHSERIPLCRARPAGYLWLLRLLCGGMCAQFLRAVKEAHLLFFFFGINNPDCFLANGCRSSALRSS